MKETLRLLLVWAIALLLVGVAIFFFLPSARASVVNPMGFLLRDEGSTVAYTTSLNCVGSTVACTAGTITVTGGSGSFSLTTVEKDLGSIPRYSGTFDITGLSGLTPDAPVLIVQAAGPYTGKGDRQDEAEMDLATATGYVVDANTIRVYWTCASGNGPLAGNVKFNYVVGG